LEKTSINVGTQAFAETAALHIAIEKGLFEARGLKVTLASATGGGAGLVAGMVAGDIDVIYSNYVSLMVGVSKGLPLRVVRENDRPGVQALYSKPGNGISKPSDLAGKRIAVNGLGGFSELTTRAVLKSYGVTNPQLIEVPPANQEAALDTGQVDAAWLVEPYVTTAIENLGVNRIVSAFEGPTADLPVAGWAVTADFAAKNPNTIAAFVHAMDEATALAVSDPQAVKDILPKYTKIPTGIIAKMNPVTLAGETDLSNLSKLNELMVDVGFLKKTVDLKDFVVDVPSRK
jgi:NitT/TauT family transport system substrate-binding protein